MKEKMLLFSVFMLYMVFESIDAKGGTSYPDINRQMDSQNKPTPSFLSKQQAVSDIDSLIYNISEIHPNMFSVCNQGEFFREINEIEKKLPDTLSVMQLYEKVQPLVAKIGDGHTSLVFPYNSVFMKDTPRIPVSFMVSSDNTVTVLFSVDNKIPEGAQVLSINGVSSNQMLQRMLSYESGESLALRMERVRNDFPALFFMLYSADSYDIEYKMSGEKKTTHHITLPPCTSDELFAWKKKTQKQESQTYEKAYSFKILPEEKVAVMDFRTFIDPAKMETFADSMFTVLRNKKITDLIIDITENGGGDSQVGDILLRYISPKPFVQFGKFVARVTPVTQNLMNRKADVGWYYGEVSDSEMVVPRTYEEGRFKGNVYLLTSNRTFSSASSFAWAFKEFGMGTVVGEETGGMNVSFGDVLVYSLPISGLKASVSYKRFWLYGADESDIHGTLPDYDVTKEAALSKALELCKKSSMR